MAYKGFVGSGTVGHFATTTALQTQYPADAFAGRMATVEGVGGTAVHFFSNGSSWLPNAQLVTDSSGNVAGIVDPVGVITYLPTSNAALRKWAGALAKARSGVRNARIALFGDSTTAGSGANGTVGFGAGARSSCPSVKLARMLRDQGQTAYASAYFGNAGPLTSVQMRAWDTQIGGAGWAFFGAASGDSWLWPQSESTVSNTTTYTPTNSVDTFVIWYGTNAGSRVFSYQVDAGGTTNVDGAGTVNGLASVTVAAGAVGAHTLTIAKGSGGGNFIWGIEAYDSTVKQVQILPMGISGTRVSQAVGATAPNSGLNALQTMAPDLTVVNLCINEWKNAGNVDTFKSNLGLLIAAAKVTGDVIVVTGVPTSIIGFPLATQKAYVDAAISVAVANGCIAVDTWRRFVSYETDTSFYTDDTHPNSAGYELMWGTVVRNILGNAGF